MVKINSRTLLMFISFSLTTENFKTFIIKFGEVIPKSNIALLCSILVSGLKLLVRRSIQNTNKRIANVLSSLACHFYGLCQKIVFVLTKIMMRPCHKMCDSRLFNDENALLIAKTADCWLLTADFIIIKIQTFFANFFSYWNDGDLVFTLISHIKLACCFSMKRAHRMYHQYETKREM